MRTGRWATLALLCATACAGDGQRSAPMPPPPTTAPPSTAPFSPTTPAVPVPRSMAALGDSMTRAFLVCDLGDCPAGSWSTGTFADVDSHALRLERLAGRPVTAHNLAVSGATVAGLPSQVERAVAAKPGYVTILIGANDACRSTPEAMTPVDEYAATFDRALTALVRGLPKARVLVASIPDLHRLWEVGRDRREVVEVWERYGVCGSMLSDARDTSPAATARRAAVRERVEAYNAAMAAACREHATCRWDGGAVYGYRFTLGEVSPRDYWHPSRAGERALSEVTWRAGYWS